MIRVAVSDDGTRRPWRGAIWPRIDVEVTGRAVKSLLGQREEVSQDVRLCLYLFPPKRYCAGGSVSASSQRLAAPTEERRILLFNKPYGVLSQFTDSQGRKTCAQYINEPGVHPCGRLDRDSEGLLVLTNDGALQHRLANPSMGASKSYWVQVEGEPTEEALAQLSAGIELKDGPTRPARIERMAEPTDLWERTPPIRVRQAIPTRWLTVTLKEGRNRQVRRMCAAVGFPVLRLIRYRVGSWTIDGLPNGAVRHVEG